MFKNWFRCGLAGLGLYCILAVFNTAMATTYYVRTDGGTSAQCTGLADAAYSGSGSKQACAFSHPYWALSPGNGVSNFTPTSALKSGDTLYIHSGSYMMGYGVVPANNACYSPSTWGCAIAGIPSGLSASQPTTITGDCSARPELWATQRNGEIFDLENVHDIKIACLELTDHSNCIDAYQPTANTGGVKACNRNTYPYGTWGSMGIYASSVTNLTLANLNIHGFADYGINAGLLAGNTIVSNVTLRANGWGGWSGDLGGNNHNSTDSGTLNFTGLIVAWNGCAEAYPATTIVGCWGQNEGGYGDGFSESWTGGTWTFTNSQFVNNTQDGLDLLYANGTGAITLKQIYAAFNAGNQVKTSGTASLQNSVINGYCNDWSGFPVGGDGSSGVAGTMCRADGDALVMLFVAPNETVNLNYNTVTGNGDVLFQGGVSDNAPSGWAPDASDVTSFYDNILLGQPSVIPRDGGAYAALDWYSDGTYKGTVTYSNNVVWHVKSNKCPATSICKDPLLTNETLAGFNPALLAGSPAIGKAVGAIPSTDYDNDARKNPTSIGALEYGSSGSSGGGSANVPPRASVDPIRYVCSKNGNCFNLQFGAVRAKIEAYSRVKAYVPRTPYSTSSLPYHSPPSYYANGADRL